MADDTEPLPEAWMVMDGVSVRLTLAGDLQLAFRSVPAPGAIPMLMGVQLPPQALETLMADLGKASVAQRTLGARRPKSGAH